MDLRSNNNWSHPIGPPAAADRIYQALPVCILRKESGRHRMQAYKFRPGSARPYFVCEPGENWINFPAILVLGCISTPYLPPLTRLFTLSQLFYSITAKPLSSSPPSHHTYSTNYQVSTVFIYGTPSYYTPLSSQPLPKVPIPSLSASTLSLAASHPRNPPIHGSSEVS